MFRVCTLVFETGIDFETARMLAAVHFVQPGAARVHAVLAIVRL